jgi:glycerophosphoryl diester phosphodiesterase
VEGPLQRTRTPLLLGHRGARPLSHFRLGAAKPKVPPENTFASFEYALASGCDGFEFDVRATRDGKLAICHNAWVRGYKVGASSFESLCSRCQTIFPCLQDVLRDFGNRAYLDIEVKVSGCETEVVEAIRENRPISAYMVSSFLPQLLRHIHHLDRSVPLGYVCNRAANLPIWRELPIQVFLPHHLLITRDLVERVHERGIQVYAWTVNRDQELRQFAEWGVDGLISDDPKLLHRVFRERASIAARTD